MCARVGDVEGIPGERDSLRVVERGLGEGTFPVTAQAAADGVLHRAAGAEDEDAVVPRVGDHDPPVRGGGDLAGKGERPLVAPLGFLQAERFGRKAPVGARLRELVRHERLQHGRIGLAWGDRRQRTVGPDDHQRRPAAHCVLRPELHLAVDRDRVRDAMALHGAQDLLGVLLRVELGGVHADHHQRIVAVPLLEVPEHRQHMHAVDAAVGPEVENDELPAQVADRRRPVDVQPGRRSREVWRVDPLAHGVPCKSPARRSGKRIAPGGSEKRNAVRCARG